jgi:hypothetical protein
MVRDIGALLLVSEGVQPHSALPETLQPRRREYTPVDVRSTYVNGFLYYPIRILRLQEEGVRDPTTGVVRQELRERVETVVVRSDRTLHAAHPVPAPKGTPVDEVVWRLQPDGMLIDGAPRPNRFASWTWNSIQRWLSGGYATPDLGKLLARIEAVFRASFWLPYDDDYTLLATTVAVTYVQCIFDAVPLIFVNGPRGTGKSTIGRVMERLAYNGRIIGSVTAAAAARHIDETRGFVVLDDVESLAGARGAGKGFTELVQALKVSYNKDTAVKVWVDATKGMRTETLNLFGVKVLNNTTGIEEILGSRCLRICTQQIPTTQDGQEPIGRIMDWSRLQSIRDDMHVWAFENVAEVAAEYARLYPFRSDRSAEIAAPLRVIAQLAGDSNLAMRLNQSLARQQVLADRQPSPIELLNEALESIIRLGFLEVSPTHLVLEMQRIGETTGRSSGGRQDWKDPSWVGRQLRQIGAIAAGEEGRRPRVFPGGVQLRVYPLRPEYREKVSTCDHPKGHQPREPLSFCGGCGACPYALHCPMRKSRLRWESASKCHSSRPG